MVTLHNFGAGPATLPGAVLEAAREELFDWKGTGMSVLEMSHRSPEFEEIRAQAENRLRQLLEIPNGYEVLFLQGGATTQFATVPLNLLREEQSAGYVLSGSWSEKAMREAKRFQRTQIVARADDTLPLRLPPTEQWSLPQDIGYVHVTLNETIDGLEWPVDLACAERVLVADASSTLLSRPLDVQRYGLLYAGAQKNFGIAGLTVVIVSEALLEDQLTRAPAALDFRMQAAATSLLNTPPCVAIYLSGLYLDWIEEQGGLREMERRAEHRSRTLYEFLDASEHFENWVHPGSRSRMNVPFRPVDETWEPELLTTLGRAGFRGLEGHRSVGGLRASLYNGLDESSVAALVAALGDFEAQHG